MTRVTRSDARVKIPPLTSPLKRLCLGKIDIVGGKVRSRQGHGEESMKKRVFGVSRGYCGLLFTASAIALAAAPALAQEAGGERIGEVVVTAEKRAQSVQDVPVAVSAFTAEAREVIGINTIQDMTNFTPGLQYNTSTDRISLRGVGRQTNVLSGDASVANYNDQVYETFAVAAGRSTLFLDRVEVLRGPQGTLYGRNAIGGAINQISRRPTDEFEGEVRFTYANYDRSVLEASLSGPIINDNIQAKIAGAWENQNEGWTDNIVPGMPDEGGVVDTLLFDGQIQAQISPKWDLWFKLAGGEWRNGAGGPGSESSGWWPSAWATYEYGVDSTQISPGFGCNTGGVDINGVPYSSATGASSPSNVVNPNPLGCTNPALNDPRTVARVVPYQVTVPFYYQSALHLTYHADDFDVKYVAGAVSYHYVLTGPANTGPNTLEAPIQSFTLPCVADSADPANTVGDLCRNFGPLSIQPDESFNYQEHNHFVSHEINLISTTEDPLQWVLGAYYFKQGYRQPVFTTNPGQPQWAGPGFGAPGFFCSQTGGVCAPNPGFNRFNNQPDIEAESYAVFGQLDYNFSEQFRGTFGLRYSHDRKWGTESVRLLCFANCVVSPEDLGVFTPAFDLGAGAIGVIDDGLPTPPRGVVGPTTYDPATGLATREYDARWQAMSGTLGLEWHPDDDTLAYARYSRGYKSGGLNIGIFTVLSASPFTDRELVDSFEVGLKRDFSDTLRTNVAVYHYLYENLQIPVLTAGAGGLAPASTTFYNVPEAISQGAEFEVQWEPIENLRMLVSYSYNNTEIQEGQAVDVTDPAALDVDAQPLLTAAACLGAGGRPDPFTAALPNGGCYRAQSLEGNSLPNAPEHKVAINGVYTIHDVGPGALDISLSYIWRGEQYGNLFTRSYNEAPAWDQIDGRLTWTADDDSYRVILYGKNLLDDIIYDAGATSYRKAGTINSVNNPGTPILVNEGIATGYSIAPPRTFGVEVQYRF
jgi:iron complex outermembrane receptor protein